MVQQSQYDKSEQPDPQFLLAKYISPILEHKWIVLFCTVLGLAVAIPASLIVKPQYSSIATTQVETARAQMVSKVTEEITSSTGTSEYILAEVEKMHSAAFRAEVLKIIPKILREDLETQLSVKGQITDKVKPYIKKILKMDSPAAIDAPQKQLNQLSNRVEITGDPRKGLISIEGITFNQDMATILVNSYLDVWVALNMESNKSLIRHDLEFTGEQRADYYTQLKNAENELRLFKLKFEIPPALTSVTDMELQSQLDVLQNKLASAMERYKRLDDIYLELSRKEKAVVNNIKIINPPQIPIAPSQDKRIRIILIGLILGAAAGIGPILAWDVYRGNIRHKKDVTNAVDVPIIGYLPTIK